ncbi:alpha/beta fold hydrolase [Buchnera aphidicola]|uniref:alpha/beta fold hydrolase n=1 Tax=Buchnera aphidicola TaxID=9 RepID=UPI00094DD1E7|nr:alpha/beta fold hydrolase [Buchnera aphidicola]
MKKKNKKIYWSIQGKGKINIVFFHGWGIYSIVWKNIVNLLKPYFTLHLIDLPGFGKSIYYPIMTFKQLSQYLLKKTKNKVIWLGWSMGGLIAHYLGYYFPNQTLAVIYVTSSPYFIREKKWPGTTIDTLNVMKKNILFNYEEFFKQFIILHALNSQQKDVLNVKKKYLFLKKYPNPKKKSIEVGYQWLTKTDQRNQKLSHHIPILRIYGALDNLVPIQTCYHANLLWPHSNYYIIAHARHAPFLSHPHAFCNIINKFIQEKTLLR